MKNNSNTQNLGAISFEIGQSNEASLEYHSGFWLSHTFTHLVHASLSLVWSDLIKELKNIDVLLIRLFMQPLIDQLALRQ